MLKYIYLLIMLLYLFTNKMMDCACKAANMNANRKYGNEFNAKIFIM